MNLNVRRITNIPSMKNATKNASNVQVLSIIFFLIKEKAYFPLRDEFESAQGNPTT